MHAFLRSRDVPQQVEACKKYGHTRVMEEQTSTVWMGNLPQDPRITRRLLYEVGIQAGPVVSVNLPLLPTLGVSSSGGAEEAKHRGYGFIEYESVESAVYAVCLFRGNLRLAGREIRVDFGGQKGSRGGRIASSRGGSSVLGDSTPATGRDGHPGYQQWEQAPPGLHSHSSNQQQSAGYIMPAGQPQQGHAGMQQQQGTAQQGYMAQQTYTPMHYGHQMHPQLYMQLQKPQPTWPPW